MGAFNRIIKLKITSDRLQYIVSEQLVSKFQNNVKIVGSQVTVKEEDYINLKDYLKKLTINYEEIT